MDWWADVERALHHISHAIVGTVAVNAYAPERPMRELDLGVLGPDRVYAEAALYTAGWIQTATFRAWLTERSFGSSWGGGVGHQVDVLALSDRWGGEALAAAQANVIAGLPTLPMSYLVLMKLEASRRVDLRDVYRMLLCATEDGLAEARAVIERCGDRRAMLDFDQLARMGQRERGLG